MEVAQSLWNAAEEVVEGRQHVETEPRKLKEDESKQAEDPAAEQEEVGETAHVPFEAIR